MTTTVLLIPPHGDPTVSWSSAEAEVLEPGRAFVARLLRAETLEGQARALEEQLLQAPEADGAFRLLQLRAAQVVGRAERPVLSRLRALGAALAGSCAPSASLQLRLDDIALKHGTTLRSADALACAETFDVPFLPELEATLEACGGRPVTLWLEQDQQLPATLWLSSRLRGPLMVGGTFGRAHWPVLREVGPQRRASLDPTPRLPTVTGAPGIPMGEPIRWCARGVERVLLDPGAPWAGEVAVSELLDPDALVRSGCRACVVAFCGLSGELLDEAGRAFPLDQVRAATDALRRSGVRVLGEWWVGAPGVDAAAEARTCELLESGSPFDRVVGLRRFRLPTDWTRPQWGDVALTFSPPPEHDLARERRFELPRTTGASATDPDPDARFAALSARIARHSPPSPGRVAQAYLTGAALPPSGVSLDPDVARVHLPCTLDGEPRASTYAVNLRTGALLALAPPLAALLDALFESGDPSRFFERFPEPQRATLRATLVAKSLVLER